MRFFIELAYNGAPFHGWQKQKNASSVQETIETCLAKIFGEEVALTGAGRTDTGVHARQLIAHFDREEAFDIPNLIYKLNRMLPKAIVVLAIYRVRDDAHARFDALWREYQYYVSLTKNPFASDFSAYVPRPVDCERMNAACKPLLTHRDFKCFSKVKTDVWTYNCKISSAKWQKEGDQLIFTIVADRFLRNMVRAIVGTLLEIGQGQRTVEDMQKILASKNRRNAGRSVPANGLFLNRIHYPNTLKIV